MLETLLYTTQHSGVALAEELCAAQNALPLPSAVQGGSHVSNVPARGIALLYLDGLQRLLLLELATSTGLL